MSRIAPLSLRSIGRLSHPQGQQLHPGHRLFTATQQQHKGTQNAEPGWTGRHGDDHAVNRDTYDSQAAAAQQGMKDHDQGTGSQATSRKDEGNNNKRAEEDHPEAPKPVIGMNSERGSKGH